VNFHAGAWRLITEAMDEAGPRVTVEVFKVKVHRDKEHVRPEELEDFVGTEAVVSIQDGKSLFFGQGF
jgi:hypothetical protein